MTLSFSSTNLIVYNYLIRENSITKSIALSQKRKVLKDKLLLIDFLQQTKEKARDQRWFDGMTTFMVLSVIGNVGKDFYSERRMVLKALKAKRVFPLSFFHSTQSNRNKILIANISPDVLVVLFHMRNIKFMINR